MILGQFGDVYSKKAATQQRRLRACIARQRMTGKSAKAAAMACGVRARSGIAHFRGSEGLGSYDPTFLMNAGLVQPWTKDPRSALTNVGRMTYSETHPSILNGVGALGLWGKIRAWFRGER